MSSAQRAQSWRPGWKRGRGWRPELVGVAPAYPKTQEAWEERREQARQRALALHARGAFRSRKGIPDGWSGRGEELAAIREANMETGQRAVESMRARGDFLCDDERAEAAMAFAVSLVLDPAICSADRLAAARLVLTYTRQRPGARREDLLVSAEDYLASLLGGA